MNSNFRQICFYIISISFAVFVFVSCKSESSENKTAASLKDGVKTKLLDAKNFEVTSFDGYKVITVLTPWKDATDQFTYVVHPKSSPPPPGFKDATFIATPVQSIVCASTTHVGLLDALNATNLIVGIAGADFIYNKDVQKKVKEGKISNVGGNPELNYELLFELNPDLVLTYGIGPDNNIAKLKHAGLTPVVISEFMDQSPLGRAEWIKFLAVILGKEDFAKKSYDLIRQEYNEAKSLVIGLPKPTVLTGMGFEGTWFVPANGSYVAQSIRDAGGNYLWSDVSGKISIALDFEAVYEKAQSAEKWINVGLVNSLREIKLVDERYSYFKAFKNGEVFNGNNRVSEGGGHDIYESAVVNPHLILLDLIKAFHPNALPDHEFYYYQQLE